MSSKKLKEKTVKAILFLCAAFSIVLVLSIVGFLGFKSFPMLISMLSHGLVGGFYSPDIGNGLIVLSAADATVYLAAGATMLAAIIGIPCAIYMAEFSGMRLRNFTKTSLEVLDGFPSIVIGLLIGYELLVTPTNRYTFTNFLVKQFKLTQGSGCIFFGWLILLVMSFPVIATLSEDALRAVPNDLREASLGLGATRWQTTRHVLFPSASPRIITSVLLALAAAMGEMVALSWVLVGTVPTTLLLNPILIFNPMFKAQTLSIVMERTYLGALDATSTPGAGAYAVGFILFVMIGTINVASRMILANRGKTME
jgi:phosphate transport system permease protein